jgi:hypothetical protein
MRGLICSLVAGVAVAAGSPASRADEAPILDLIALLPEDPTTYRSMPLFSYVDFRAVEAAAGVATPGSESAFAALPEAERMPWYDSLKRITVGPPPILLYAARVGLHEKTSYDATGPDWFMVDRAMAAWQAPPHAVTILGGDEDMTDPQGFDFVLPQRGFANEDIDGVSVWSRFGDNAIASALKDEAIEGDIFDEGLMTSLRLAVLPGRLIASRSWPDLRAMLGVATGGAKPAAAADLLRPMVEALGAVEGGDGPLVQAMAFTLVDVGLANSGTDLMAAALAEGGSIDFDALAARVAAAPSPGRPPLPVYPLVLFADVAAGPDQVNIIALPYADRATAAMAATVLAERLAKWQPGAFKQPVVSLIGGEIATAVVDDQRVAPAAAATFIAVMLAAAAGAENAPDGEAAEPTFEVPDVPPGGAVALVAIRYPPPAVDSDVRPTAFFSIALQAIHNRDFAPLSVP